LIFTGRIENQLFNQTERYFTTILLYWNIFPPDFIQIIKDFSGEWQ